VRLPDGGHDGGGVGAARHDVFHNSLVLNILVTDKPDVIALALALVVPARYRGPIIATSERGGANS
jgi:hypothetical protein